MKGGYSLSAGGYDTVLLSALFAGFYSSTGFLYVLAGEKCGIEALAKMAIIAQEIEAPEILASISSVLQGMRDGEWKNVHVLVELLRHVYARFSCDISELKQFLIKVVVTSPEKIIHNPAMHVLMDEYPQLAIDIVKRIGQDAVSAWDVSGRIEVEEPPLS